ncbi:DUF2497 domain-containing protein [Acuticoccus kandeliae]|uniref:DUF2497 domain-containing protein n=1 Tax=Acuticoccus kandeliae TaxID=2073160 RepID=UPI0013006CE4|nr:DUF2497 domain-containing protein [Acuticoccus kandeliae]
MASIRKIIADEAGAEMSAAASRMHAARTRSDRVEPGAYAPPAERSPESIERSVSAAFDNLDLTEEDEIDEAIASLPEIDDDDPDEDALTSIARAIAAECEVRRSRPGAEQSGWPRREDRHAEWSPVVLSEPDIDETYAAEDCEGRVADAIPLDEDEATFVGRARAAAPEPEPVRIAQPAPVHSRLAALKSAFQPQHAPQTHTQGEADAAARAAMKPRPSPLGTRTSPAASEAVAPQRPQPARPQPQSQPPRATPVAEEAAFDDTHAFETDHRMDDMSETVMDSKIDAEGNVFRRAAPRAEMDDSLTSQKTRQSVTNSLDQLSRTILSNNPRTLEDLVRDMVRPLLREWLEANLPDIVERQVRQEIDRVASRGR